jgi:hypothetical protein
MNMNSVKKRNIIAAVCVIVLLIIVLFLLLLEGKKSATKSGAPLPAMRPPGDTSRVSIDTMHHAPAVGPETKTARQAAPVRGRMIAPRETVSGPIMDTSENTGDTTAAAPVRGHMIAPSRKTVPVSGPVMDTSESAGNTAAAMPDTAAVAPKDPCDGDTVPPWAYPDPSGGLHRGTVSVFFGATKPCIIEWKADSSAPWKTYARDTIRITATTTLFFRAQDSCGNRMEEREEYYEIQAKETSRFCPGDMEYVKVGETRFCIDHYEWPNRKNAAPLSFVSIYNAMDSCAGARKHLCTSDEWTLACTGPYGWKYPYGAAYEPHACVSHDTTARPSGSRPECRGYFEVYDMAGNLAEWTDTRSNRNSQFYNVKGGFWESGPHTGCFDVRYSYYPQNRHNPVGFRCCAKAAPQ